MRRSRESHEEGSSHTVGLGTRGGDPCSGHAGGRAEPSDEATCHEPVYSWLPDVRGNGVPWAPRGTGKQAAGAAKAGRGGRAGGHVPVGTTQAARAAATSWQQREPVAQRWRPSRLLPSVGRPPTHSPTAQPCRPWSRPALGSAPTLHGSSLPLRLTRQRCPLAFPQLPTGLTSTLCLCTESLKASAAACSLAHLCWKSPTGPRPSLQYCRVRDATADGCFLPDPRHGGLRQMLQIKLVTHAERLVLAGQPRPRHQAGEVGTVLPARDPRPWLSEIARFSMSLGGPAPLLSRTSRWGCPST